MKRLLLMFFYLVGSNLSAQNEDWISENKDNVEVKYKVYTLNGEDDDRMLIAEYIAKSSCNCDLSSIKELMTDASNYKSFLENTTVTKEVGRTNENEWTMYLFIDAPWPVANSDCIQKVQLVEVNENEFYIEVEAAPEAYPKQDVKRMTLSEVKYSFRKIDDQVEINIESKFSPIGKIPEWMMKTWFPAGPAGLVNRMIENL